MYASPARSTLVSGVLHGAAIALILMVTGVKPPMPAMFEHTTLITPRDLVRYDVRVRERADGGGGGGMRTSTPASLGNLPRRATHQLMEPMVKVENPNPVLTIEPTIIANPDIPVPTVNIAAIGDPHGVAGAPSAGAGDGGGIGPGHGTGIGPGSGPGAGPGDDGGVSGSRAGFRGAVTEPVLLFKAEPEYSEEARKAKLQGSVMIRAEIDARGQIQNIVIAQGLGLGLDERAVEAVKKWRFKPGMRNGKPVPTNTLIQVSFRLL